VVAILHNIGIGISADLACQKAALATSYLPARRHNHIFGFVVLRK